MSKHTRSSLNSTLFAIVAMVLIALSAALLPGCDSIGSPGGGDQLKSLQSELVSIRAAATQAAADARRVTSDATTRAAAEQSEAGAERLKLSAELAAARLDATTRPAEVADRLAALEGAVAAAQARAIAAEQAARVARKAEEVVQVGDQWVTKIDSSIESVGRAVERIQRDPASGAPEAIGLLPIPEPYKSLSVIVAGFVGAGLARYQAQRKITEVKAEVDEKAAEAEKLQAALKNVVRSVDVVFPNRTTEQKLALAKQQGWETSGVVNAVK